MQIIAVSVCTLGCFYSVYVYENGLRALSDLCVQDILDRCARSCIDVAIIVLSRLPGSSSDAGEMRRFLVPTHSEW